MQYTLLGTVEFIRLLILNYVNPIRTLDFDVILVGFCRGKRRLHSVESLLRRADGLHVCRHGFAHAPQLPRSRLLALTPGPLPCGRRLRLQRLTLSLQDLRRHLNDGDRGVVWNRLLRAS